MEEPEVGPARPPPTADDEDDEPAVGPSRPPADDATATEDTPDVVGPLPPAKRKRAMSAEEEALYLQQLPCAEMYERSFMHRDAVTHVLETSTDFFVTGSADGHLKFWKKRVDSVEFVKHYRSHPAAVVDMAVSADGELLVTVGGERSAKVYDVLSYDMCGILSLAFVPSACEWVFARGEAVCRLAVADAGSGSVHVFDGRAAPAGVAAPLFTVSLHAFPATCMRFNPPLGCVISCDAGGHVELWHPASGVFASASVSFRFKADTDLYAHARAKTAAGSVSVSGDGEQFATFAADRRVRVFRTRSCKLRCVLDESLEAAAEAQRSGPPVLRLDDIDYGRRLAVERELGRDWAAGATPLPNVLFDDSGEMVLYATHIGIKVVNLATRTLARLIGRFEHNERFTRLALLQGARGRDTRGRSAADDAAARARATAAAAAAAGGGGAGGTGAASMLLPADPTLAAVAFRKHRVYFFTRREPADVEDAAAGRDVFNERPTAEEGMRALAAPANASGLPSSAVIHTSLGDIGLRLFGEECPRTVENWATLARTGYYDNLIIHRVIKGFMIQTGDPLGDGTGGASCWGGEFEDEFRRDLRHDRPYTLSMANAGPNTNGSQFFITVCACPWLDNKHTVFGRVTKGADVVHTIERAKTGRGDKPIADIKILSVTLSI